MEQVKSFNVLICVTGSVAAIKLRTLVETLLSESKCKFSLNVRVCFTDSSLHFCPVEDLSDVCKVYRDSDEWCLWQGRGDPVLHIDLVKWAHLLLIAPLDANSLGKIASGICDNLVLCVVRAWDTSKPLLFCPAMNTRMWTHPVTATQIDLLASWGYTPLPPIAKTLMCGDTGIGAMMEPRDIVTIVLNRLEALPAS